MKSKKRSFPNGKECVLICAGRFRRTRNYLEINQGEPFTLTVLTAINADPAQIEDYGDKFYDITKIEGSSTKIMETASITAATSNRKIKVVENPSDMLSIAQKERAVKNNALTYTTGKTTEKTAPGRKKKLQGYVVEAEEGRGKQQLSR